MAQAYGLMIASQTASAFTKLEQHPQRHSRCSLGASVDRQVFVIPLKMNKRRRSLTVIPVILGSANFRPCGGSTETKDDRSDTGGKKRKRGRFWRWRNVTDLHEIELG
jgi:hypothetical protein